MRRSSRGPPGSGSRGAGTADQPGAGRRPPSPTRLPTCRFPAASSSPSSPCSRSPSARRWPSGRPARPPGPAARASRRRRAGRRRHEPRRLPLDERRPRRPLRAARRPHPLLRRQHDVPDEEAARHGPAGPRQLGLQGPLARRPQGLELLVADARHPGRAEAGPAAADPSAPRCASSPSSDTSVALAFGASKDEFGVKAYEILANGHRVAVDPSTTPVVTGLKCGTAYTFTAVARDAAGNRSRPSPPARARTRTCVDNAPPSVPAGLEAASVTDVAVALRWPDERRPRGQPGGLHRHARRRRARPPDHARLHRRAARRRPHLRLRRPQPRQGRATSPRRRRSRSAPACRSSPPASCTPSCWPRTARASATSRRTTPRSASSTRRTTILGADLGLEGQDQPHVTRFAQQRGVKVLPRVECQDANLIAALLNNPAARATA